MYYIYIYFFYLFIYLFIYLIIYIYIYNLVSNPYWQGPQFGWSQEQLGLSHISKVMTPTHQWADLKPRCHTAEAAPGSFAPWCRAIPEGNRCTAWAQLSSYRGWARWNHGVDEKIFSPSSAKKLLLGLNRPEGSHQTALRIGRVAGNKASEPNLSALILHCR